MSHSCRWSNRRSAKGNTGFQYLVEEVSLAAVLATDALSQSHSLGPVRLARGNQLGPLVLAEATLIHDANGIACGLGERHYLVAQLQRGKTFYKGDISDVPVEEAVEDDEHAVVGNGPNGNICTLKHGGCLCIEGGAAGLLHLAAMIGDDEGPGCVSGKLAHIETVEIKFHGVKARIGEVADKGERLQGFGAQEETPSEITSIPAKRRNGAVNTVA